MGDPFRIFAGATSSRQETLRITWRELYDALAGIDNDAGPKLIGCPSARHWDMEPEDRPRVVGRIRLNGHPACGPCIEVYADRPGGYPLERTDPREWRKRQ